MTPRHRKTSTMSVDGSRDRARGRTSEHGLGLDAEGLPRLGARQPTTRSTASSWRSSSADTGAARDGPQRPFDTVDGPGGVERGDGVRRRPGRPAAVSSSTSLTRPDHVRLAATHDFTFVLDGPGRAVHAARKPPATGTST